MAFIAGAVFAQSRWLWVVPAWMVTMYVSRLEQRAADFSTGTARRLIFLALFQCNHGDETQPRGNRRTAHAHHRLKLHPDDPEKLESHSDAL